MKDRDEAATFVITTQADHRSAASKHKQISAARSYAAHRRHSKRREQEAAASVLRNQAESQKVTPGFGHAQTETLVIRVPAQRVETPQHHPFDTNVAAFDDNVAAFDDEDYDEEEEDISIQDVINIFQPDKLSNKSNGRLNEAIGPVSTVVRRATGRHDSDESTHWVSSKATHYSRTVLQDPLGTDSTIDPFLQIPFDITGAEKSLIHFYLSYGRRWLWGTSVDPKYCPVLDLARTQLQTDPVHAMTVVVTAESLLNRLTHRTPRSFFYLRRAQMYGKVNAMISDEKAPFHLKMLEIMHLITIEHMNKNFELQALHLRALDEFIESRSGLKVLCTRIKDVDLLCLIARFYANQFVRSQIRIPTVQQFKPVSESFIRSLYHIQTWFSCYSLSYGVDSNSATIFSPRLRLLRNYLSQLLDRYPHKSSENSFYESSSIHFCAFSLAITLTEYNEEPEITMEFLFQIQEYMRQSTDVSQQFGNELNNLHPSATAHIIGRVRSEMFPERRSTTEIDVLQRFVDAQKVYALMNERTRKEILSWLITNLTACIEPNADGHGTIPVRFGLDKLESLEIEMLQAWIDQRENG